MIWYKEEVVSSCKYAYAKYFKDIILKCKSSMIKQIKCYNCQDVMAAEMWGNFSNDLFHVIHRNMSYQDVTYFKRKNFKSGQYFWESSQPSPINPNCFLAIHEWSIFFSLCFESLLWIFSHFTFSEDNVQAHKIKPLMSNIKKSIKMHKKKKLRYHFIPLHEIILPCQEDRCVI